MVTKLRLDAKIALPAGFNAIFKKDFSMIKYVTKENDVLDWIVWKHYGTSDVLETVLKANPTITDEKLKAGIEIKLPYISTNENKQKEIKLWN